MLKELRSSYLLVETRRLCQVPLLAAWRKAVDGLELELATFPLPSRWFLSVGMMDEEGGRGCR